MARIRVGSTSDPLSHIAAVGAKTLISLQNTKARNCEGHIDSIIPLTLPKRVSAALLDMCTISLAVAQVHAKVECIGRSCRSCRWTLAGQSLDSGSVTASLPAPLGICYVTCDSN